MVLSSAIGPFHDLFRFDRCDLFKILASSNICCTTLKHVPAHTVDPWPLRCQIAVDASVTSISHRHVRNGPKGRDHDT